MVNGEEIDELLEVLDLLIGDLNRRLQSKYVALFLRLGFKQRFDCGLTSRKLLQLLLIISLLLFSGQLSLHHSFATLQTIVHALHIEVLALHPDVGIAVWVLCLLLRFLHSFLQVGVAFICQDSLSSLLIGIVGETDLLVLH